MCHIDANPKETLDFLRKIRIGFVRVANSAKKQAAFETLHLASNACVYTNLTNREISDGGNLPAACWGETPQPPDGSNGFRSATPCVAVLFFLLMLSGTLLVIGIHAQKHLGVGLINLELFCLVTRLGKCRIIELLLHEQIRILRLQALDCRQFFQRQIVKRFLCRLVDDDVALIRIVVFLGVGVVVCDARQDGYIVRKLTPSHGFWKKATTLLEPRHTR